MNATYYIGDVRDYESFYSYASSDFYTSLKRKVEAAVPKSARRCDWKLFVKSALIASLYAYAMTRYITHCDFFSTLLLAFAASQVGVNIMHDGNHSAFSSNKTVNVIAGYALDIVFSSSLVYRRSHNFGHHGCVNHYELDRAFDTSYPLLRLHRLQNRVWFHRYQQFYVWIVYGLVNFSDVIYTFDEMTWMSNYPTRQGHCPEA